MCVNLIDLNKHCPKDYYPLSSINQKIKAVFGYNVLNFLDLYKGFHQDHMDRDHTSKIAFITY